MPLSQAVITWQVSAEDGVGMGAKAINKTLT
jgi:hypothetical protein